MRNEKLIAAREDRGWSQAVAAEKIGVSRVAYARWEEQGLIPRLWAMNRAREEFNMSAEQLGFRKYPTNASANGRLVQDPPKYIPEVTDAVGMFEVAIMALLLARQQNQWTFGDLKLRVESAIRRLDDMEHDTVSRRQALSFLASLPIAFLGFTYTGQSSMAIEETLPLYVTGIPACWKLYYAGEWLEVEQVLPTYISHLTPLAQQSAKYQQSVASLLSQAHQLGSEIALQREDFGTSLTYCKQALLYGQIAGDVNLQAASLIRKGNTLFYRKRPTLETYVEAMQHIDGVTPLLRGRIYSEMGAKQDGKQDMLRFMGMAHETTPDTPEEDPYFLYSHSDHYILHFNDAFAYLKFNQPKEASQAITKAATFVPDVINPRRMELVKYQVITSIALNDLEQSNTLFEVMAASAATLGSDLWISDLHDTHQQLLVKWPNERRIKALADLFQ